MDVNDEMKKAYFIGAYEFFLTNVGRYLQLFHTGAVVRMTYIWKNMPAEEKREDRR